MALAELVEKGAQDEVVRERLTHVAERLMEFELEQRTASMVHSLARKFGVSEQAMRFRLIDLGFLRWDAAHDEVNQIA